MQTNAPLTFWQKAEALAISLGAIAMLATAAVQSINGTMTFGW